MVLRNLLCTVGQGNHLVATGKVRVGVGEAGGGPFRHGGGVVLKGLFVCYMNISTKTRPHGRPSTVTSWSQVGHLPLSHLWRVPAIWKYSFHLSSLPGVSTLSTISPHRSKYTFHTLTSQDFVGVSFHTQEYIGVLFPKYILSGASTLSTLSPLRSNYSFHIVPFQE